MDSSHEREWKLRSEVQVEIATDAHGTLIDASLKPESVESAEKAALIERLSQETGLAPLTLEVCLMRGLSSAQAIREFLMPRLESLKDPLTLRDMDRALVRLEQARVQGDRIRIYGDYDVDGTTGAALLAWFFQDCGYTFDVRQPDRFKDGYGLHPASVEEAHAAGVRLLVTVDCGISSFDAARRARELGVDLLVVDHHQLDPARGLPEAVAVINPQRPDCPSGLKQLCGCGLAFYLARALRSYGKERGWWTAGSEPNLKQHLDLVVLATAADMVPLVGDNHVLVRHGMEVLRQSRKPGVRALMSTAGLNPESLTPGSLGFVLGPRINASGRMGSASLALELLTTSDGRRAAELATQLEKINQERAEVQNRIWDEVKKRVEDGLAKGRFRHGIVVGDPSWHEGVVGIVASRVTETFHRPAAVIALREGKGKGSVRSFGGKDILAALRSSAASLVKFGGHRFAAGLTLEEEKLEEFSQAFDQALAELPSDPAMRPLLIEGSCSLEDLDLKALQEIELLGPFGPGNPEPVFAFRAQVVGHQILKGRHLKLQLGSSSGDGARARTVEAIWFHAAEREEAIVRGDASGEMEWAGVPELNRFRGRVTPTLRVKDWRRVQ